MVEEIDKSYIKFGLGGTFLVIGVGMLFFEPTKYVAMLFLGLGVGLILSH